MDAIVARQDNHHKTSQTEHLLRGRRGDQIKVLWADSDGLCLFTKRLERGRFVWPVTRDGKVHLTPAQLSMLLEGINWKHPKRTERAGIRI
ncbi:transposase [Escherichia coli M605]|uniref:Transposase n=1 Tax=Escherichia coli M605 TaxID=656417 RepID=F4T7S5_ECOLX|nr:transposase [Escherichia coli M605]